MYLLDRLLEPLLVRSARNASRLPPTFVIGAPRSGTTVVSLHLAGTFRFAWIAAAANRRPWSPWAATRRALARGGAWVPTTANAYGVAPGDLAPSDGWNVLCRYFGEYGEPGDFEDPRELVALVGLLEGLFDAPFLNKNNANTVRVARLDELFPDARFVLVTRDRVDAAASLLAARRHHGIARDAWWSAAAPDLLGRAFESELDQVVATLVRVEAHARAALARLDPARWTAVDYAAFCAAPAAVADRLEESYRRAGHPLERRAAAPPAAYEVRRLPGAERGELAARVAALEARWA